MSWRQHPWVQWFNSRTQRERMLLIAAVVAIVTALWSETGASYLEKLQRETQDRLENQRQENARLTTELAILAQKAQPDFAARTEAELAQLRREIAQLDARLRATQKTLITPEEMRTLLRTLVQGAAVSLEQLDQQPPERLQLPGIPPEHAATIPPLIRHPFHLAVRGPFPALLAFLRHYEALPNPPTWQRVTVRPHQYPELTLEIELETLSLQEVWLAF